MDSAQLRVRMRRLLLLIVSLLGSYCYTPSFAQTLLEEIIVTAQKREEPLSDVGISVTAFSGEQIKSLGFTQSTDLAGLAPGVFITSDSAGQNKKFTIRGVTQNDFIDSIEAPVAVYVDEAYVTAQQGQLFGNFDLERIEVLRGPQGTLFGRNATGGLVHFVSRKPSLDETVGFLDLQYARFNTLRAEAALNVPISDTLAVRISGLFETHDPMMKNDFPDGYFGLNPSPQPQDDLLETQTKAFRGHLRYMLDSLDITVSGYASQTDAASGAYETRPAIAVFNADGGQIDTLFAGPDEVREAIGPNGVGVALPFVDGEVPGLNEDGLRPVPGGDLFGYRDTNLGDFRGSWDFAQRDNNEFDSYGVTGNLRFDLTTDVSLVAISDFKRYEKHQALDASASPASQFLFMSEADIDSFSQEVRLNRDAGKLRWLAGLYYLYIDTETNQGLSHLADSVFVFFPPPFGLNFDPTGNAPGPPVDLVTEISLKTNSYSAFAQLQYDLTDRLTMTLGGRVVEEEKQYTFVQNTYVNDIPGRLETNSTFGVNLTPAVADDFSDTLWALRAGLDYHANPDSLYYLSFTRGVKAGSINGPIPNGPPFDTTNLVYEPEVLLAYEAGFKLSLFEGKARLNGSIYHYDYQDYQAFTFANFSGFITNEVASYYGGELEFTVSPMAGLDIMLSGSYIDAEVKDLQVAPGDLRDVEPAYTPEFTLSGIIRYTWPVFGGNAAWQFDGNYASDYYFNQQNFTAHEIESYFVGNGRFSWSPGNERFELSAFVENIFDERYIFEGFDTANLSGLIEYRFANPRMLGVAVRINF